MDNHDALRHSLSRLTNNERNHINGLVGEWGMLADFCFGDLVLYLLDEDNNYVLSNHIRPLTTQTLYTKDLVGEVHTPQQRPLVHEAYGSAAVVSGEVISQLVGEHVRVTSIPVTFEDHVIAVLSRESIFSFRSRSGQLEGVYSRIFDAFTHMIAAGQYPYSSELEEHHTAQPRVGDGVVLVDARGRVEYASPNAVSALTRFGANIELGRTLSNSGFITQSVHIATHERIPTVDENESDGGAAITMRALPFLGTDETMGAVVLLRDVTDLRRRDRQLLSKDATIREIHHRVKNNLQTISSLLRLAGRRLEEPSARDAVDESVRRIRSIALVHETLSYEAGDDVPFRAVLRNLVRMVQEGLVSAERPVTIEIHGDAGMLPSLTATSMSVVLTELLQNVLQHAYPSEISLEDAPGHVTIELRRTLNEVLVTIKDNGVGMSWTPRDENHSLGMSIVTTLVETELVGTIDVSTCGGVPPRVGTQTDLRIPLINPEECGCNDVTT